MIPFHRQLSTPLKLSFPNQLQAIQSPKSAFETCSFSTAAQYLCLLNVKQSNVKKIQCWSHHRERKQGNTPSLLCYKTDNNDTYLYLILVWEGRSLLEYCLDSWLKSPSPFPLPPLAGSNVGLAAVVILVTTESRAKNSHYYNLEWKIFTRSYVVPGTVAAIANSTTQYKLSFGAWALKLNKFFLLTASIQMF